MSKLEKPRMKLVLKTPIEILRDRKVMELLKSMNGETQSEAAINLRLPADLKKKLIDIAKEYKMPYGLIIRAIIEEFINLDDRDKSLFLSGKLKSKPEEPPEKEKPGSK